MRDILLGIAHCLHNSKENYNKDEKLDLQNKENKEIIKHHITFDNFAFKEKEKAVVDSGYLNINIIEYAPKIFAHLRQLENIDIDGMIESFLPKNNKQGISESQGKSGSFFISTDDNYYMVKTLRVDEFELIRHTFLNQYVQYITNNKGSLLCRIYGMYNIILSQGEEILIIVMRNVLGDFKDNRKQFIAIFLMSFITLLAFSGIGSELQGLHENLDDYYNQTNMADVYALGIDFNDSLINDFKDMDSTKEIERQFVVKSTARLDDEPIVTLHFMEKNNISKYYPVVGGNIDFDDEDGIWLEARFAEAKDLKIGDTISLELNGIVLNKTIRGLGYSPDYVYEEPDNGLIADFEYQGFGYLSSKAYPAPNIQYNKLLIKTDANKSVYYDETHKMLEDKGHGDIINTAAYMPREDSVSDKQIQDEIKQHEILAVMFPIIFVIVALLILLTTITRIVNNQRTQIGTLKAIGFDNRSLMLHYLSYGFILTLLGSVLGIIIGYRTIPYIFILPMQAYYTLPNWGPGFNVSFIIVGLLMVFGSLLCSYVAIKNIVRESPAATLRAKPPKSCKMRFIENTKI